MNIEDVKYIATNMGNLSGIPVRIYEGRNKIFYYSIINLPVDPIECHVEELFKTKGSVSYFLDSFFFYYGVISFGNYKLVVGPARQISIKEQDLKDYAFSNNVDANHFEDFVNSVKAIINMPLSSLLVLVQLSLLSLPLQIWAI